MADRSSYAWCRSDLVKGFESALNCAHQAGFEEGKSINPVFVTSDLQKTKEIKLSLLKDLLKEIEQKKLPMEFNNTEFSGGISLTMEVIEDKILELTTKGD